MIADLTLAPASGGKATVYIASDEAEAHKLTPGGEREWAYTGHSEDGFGIGRVEGVAAFPGASWVSQGLVE